ncbi:uncharacterized protein YcbX [Bradyrhizobium sp. USDA 4011]
MIRIKDLFVYPIKSCKGIRVSEIELSRTGFLGDRNWMIVDEAGVFVTQREYPKLALVEPTLSESNLTLNAPGMTTLVIPRQAPATRSREVELFGEKMPSLFAGDEPSKWFGEYLGGNFQFVCRDPGFLRKGGVQYPSRDEAPTSFVDNYGILVISEASRNDLNKRLVTGVPMNRFRPNIVIEGVDAYGEDYFARARVDDITLRFVDVCYRCNMTTIDQEKAEFGQEPLQTLGRYRGSKAGVRFGSYAAVAGGVGKKLTAGSSLEIALNF